MYAVTERGVVGLRQTVPYFGSNDNNNAPEQPIDMRMKKDNKAKV